MLATVAVPRNICHRRETTHWWTLPTTSNASTPQPVQCGPSKGCGGVEHRKPTVPCFLDPFGQERETASQVWEEMDTISQVKTDIFWRRGLTLNYGIIPPDLYRKMSLKSQNFGYLISRSCMCSVRSDSLSSVGSRRCFVSVKISLG